MQLRSTTRLPGRYREDDIPELPGTAAFVHPTVPYNPNLPPAAFPTLDYPHSSDTQLTEVMAIPVRPDSPESDPEQQAPAKRATVFHGKQKSYSRWLKRRLSSDTETGDEELSEPNTSRLQEWNLSDENVTEPGEYDGYGVMANDAGNDESPRIGLRAYELAGTWSRVTDGLKLIITMELTAVYSFTDAMKKLMLTEEEENEVADLCEQEVIRQAEEKDKIARSQACQLQILMSRGSDISREAASASFMDLYNGVEDSPAFMITKSDITCAQRFLSSVKLKEYADRLWQYEGVAQLHIAWNGFLKANEPSLSGKKRRNAALVRKVNMSLSGAKPVKHSRVENRTISSKLPSGLRKSISGNDLEETVAFGPPALQATFTPRKRPAPPPVRRSVKKKPGTPLVRFVKKSPTLPSTPASRIYNPLEHTPNSPTAGKKTHSRLEAQVEPYTPLLSLTENTPSPVSTPSRVPKVQLVLSEKKSSLQTTPSPMPTVRLTVAQARLARIDNILGKKADVLAKAITPDQGHTISIAPRMGNLPEIMSENTRSASRHADIKLTPGNGSAANDARKAAEPVHKQGGMVNELNVPTSDVQSESIAIAPPQKKRIIQGEEDSAYRAPGERKRKIQEQNESSGKEPAQKRRKIQDDKNGAEQQSVDRKTNRNDMAGTDLEGAAASHLTVTNLSVSEASAAKFKGVKLLEQVISVPAAKTSNSMNGRKMKVENEVAGRMHKTAHEP